MYPPPDGPPAPAPRPRAPRRGRSYFVVATVAAATAVGLTAVAFVGSDDETIVLDVDDAATDAPPVTVAPLPPPERPAPSATRGEEPAATTPQSERTPAEGDVDEEPELSPLAALLGPRFSTIPEVIEPRPRPVGVISDRIDIADFPVRAVGLEENGELEVPDETEIGWYQYGATAGRPGATVLAAHVSWNDTTGPFFRLGTKEPGDRLIVTLDDGTVREYEVTERTMYDKDQLPRERIWRNTGPETLVLITCGGDFNPEIRRYRQNIVVYAVPVA